MAEGLPKQQRKQESSSGVIPEIALTLKGLEEKTARIPQPRAEPASEDEYGQDMTVKQLQDLKEAVQSVRNP